MKYFLSILLLLTPKAWGSDPAVEALKQHVVTVLPHIEGWCSKEKALSFIDLVLETQPKTCVEIGVFGGSSLFPVASALKFLKQGVIIAIDPWDRLECIKYLDPIKEQAHFQWWAKVNLNYMQYLFTTLLQQHNLENYCITMRMTSEKAARQIENIDILYIDGNHYQKCSTQDVELYLPKVNSNGYIWINDTLAWDRQEAVELLRSQCEVVKVIDDGNCILFKKR